MAACLGVTYGYVNQLRSGLRQLRGKVERELDQRWARNTMLNKWLEYCVERGHRFPQAGARV